MMQIDPLSLGQHDLYKLLVGCVVPRPIAWVSTVDPAGVRNLAPFSFFNLVASSPPAVSVSFSATAAADPRKDTLRNIQATGAFVVNIVDEALAAVMNETATDFPPDVDEFAITGLTALPGTAVAAPRVAESPVSMECRLLAQVPVGSGPGGATLVIGTVVWLHLRDDLLDQRGRVDIHKLRPVARLAGNSYAYVHETFDLVRGRYNPATRQIDPAT